MKKFLLALLCVLMTAGFAFAVDVDIKGMYNARGTYMDNDDGLGEDGNTGAYDYFFFDHELDITTRLLVTDKTRVVVNFEIHDENWLAGNTDGKNQDGTSNLDDNIEFKRVFSSHTFDAYGTVLDLGLMTGGAWAFGFGDNGNGKYRVKVSQPTEFGPIIAIYEKNAELGATSGVKNGEDDDGNAYYLAMVTKLGDFNILPLIGYVDNSQVVLDQGGDGVQVALIDLGVSATFGDFGFESEFAYQDIKTDVPGADDYKKYGAYGNAWLNIGAGKVGFLAAYGNWDNDGGTGYGFGEDFTPTVFGADQATIGTSGLSEYMAVSMFQLYGSLALSEELSISGAGLYWMSNSDETIAGADDYWKDADGYEINLGLDWKLTDQVTYTIASGFGKISLDSNATNAGNDPDSFARVYHKFQINF
jgi:hypothetical protein